MVRRSGTCGDDIVGLDDPSAILEQPELDPGVDASSTHLVEHDVLAFSDEHDVAGCSQRPQGDLVGHDAGWHEHRRLGPDQSGKGGFELVDGGVLAVPIVAHRRCGDGLAHLLGRLGDRVAA